PHPAGSGCLAEAAQRRGGQDGRCLHPPGSAGPAAQPAMSAAGEDAPARILKILRPPVEIGRRTERIILLVGAAALFAGYDINLFGLATVQIQQSLHIAENQIGPTLAYFRFAAIVSLVLAASADLVGRRRLLLLTIFGQA